MKYSNYQYARDAAWRILLDCGVDKLPVRTSMLCRKLGIKLMEADIQQDGYSTITDTAPYIVVRGCLGNARKRFTAAHELGHIVLEHVGHYELVNREPEPGDNPVEQAANVFASRLLAPACVLWGCGVMSPEDIMALCDISAQAAAFRWERMQTLYERNRFLTSPLEQMVYAQFMPFILTHRLPASSDQALTGTALSAHRTASFPHNCHPGPQF